MKIQLSDHFTYKRLLRFVLPSILMILCTSVYSIVDGFFVSNYVGKTPFAAVNLIMPILMAVATLGFMIGTGGSAMVSKTMGEGKKELANEYFSMLIVVALVAGAIVSVLGFIFARPIAIVLGATDALLADCVLYARICFVAMPFFILQFAFQSFFVAAEKPGLSLVINIAAGIANGILDYLLIAVFPLGLAGAAIATAAGQIIGGLAPVIYFMKKNNSLLQITRFHMNFAVLGKVCVNGSSEMVTNLSASVVNVLYNFQLMKLAGENGIAAYGVIMYINIVFMAIFLGYSIGSAPIVSYHYGAGNHDELHNLYRKSMTFLVISGVLLLIASELLSRPLSAIFTSYDAELMELTVRGFRIYSIAFLIMGINVWGSSFFTALNNGMVSAIISFLRTLVFQIIVILILPMLWGVDGIWFAIVAAEAMALFVTMFFLLVKKKQYHY